MSDSAIERGVQRTATGAACAVFDDGGQVLLVKHTYGRENWELPGGLGEPGESPDETAARELLEETGLAVQLDRLTGVYFEPDHDFGEMLHFVFCARWSAGPEPSPSSNEIVEVGWWSVDDLPRPMSDFTEHRILDAVTPVPGGRVARIATRRWLT
jgi:8-oxo-dGTP diphosphatase